VRYPTDIEIKSIGPNEEYKKIQRGEIISGTHPVIIDEFRFTKNDQFVATIEVYKEKHPEPLTVDEDWYFCASQFDLNNVLINKMIEVNSIPMLYRKASWKTDNLTPENIYNYYCFKNSDNYLLTFVFTDDVSELSRQILATFKFIK
jgi:hypothetical protein